MHRNRLTALNLLSQCRHFAGRCIPESKMLPDNFSHWGKKLLRLKCAIDHTPVWQVEKLWIKVELLLNNLVAQTAK
ncbi:MAG: hypothetical protein NTZ08_13590 [Verrucomicrobia bacterium]|nr:hypothetical protein [Verrucomicrobiota bacterium]